MRYSPVHKEHQRLRLIEQARSISKAEGFNTTGVDRLMSAVGLTGAAFYRHFPSKQALFSTLVQREASQSLGMLAGDGQVTDDEFARCLRGYLSFAHARNVSGGCAIPALGAEIARGDPADRRVLEQSLLQLQMCWAKRLDHDSDGAWSALAQCVGALMLARVVESDKVTREILAAVRRTTSRQFGVSSSSEPADASQHQNPVTRNQADKK